MVKITDRLVIIALVLSTIIIFTISARGCPKRGRNLVGSSNNIFIITAPSNLTVVAVSPYQIVLNWQDNSNNEDGFEIERSLNGSNFQIINSVDSNAYDDIGLLPSTTYYYRVRAFNTIGDRSGYSNEASATTFDVIWSAVAAYENHTFALAINGSAQPPVGTLWAWGQNTYGQLGLGDQNNRVAPNLIAVDFFYNIFEAVDIIATGFAHSIARKTDGTLWTWGDNSYGELGLGDTLSGNEPYPIGTDSDWATVTAGDFYSLAIKTNGTIWAWGNNDRGQLGLGYTSLIVVTPSQIDSNSDWVEVGADGRHTIARKVNGTLWAWGNNNFGQLGLGYTNPVTNSVTAPIEIGTDSDWSRLGGTRYDYTVCLKTNRTLWVWGLNFFGQLGLGDSGATTNRTTPTQIGTDSDWSIIAVGQYHTIACKTDGTIWGWSWNLNGQLGLGDTISRFTPTLIDSISNWVAIAAGRSHSIGIKDNQTIWAWGVNNSGQLGVGDRTNRTTPTQTGLLIPEAPNPLTVSIISNTQFDLFWTDNSNNEIGFKIERKVERTGTYEQIAIVDADISSYSDITATGFAPYTYYYYRVKAYNGLGETNSSYEVCASISGRWSKIAGGSSHTIASKTNGTLWSWGINYSSIGQLGLGDYNYRNTPSQVGTGTDWASVAFGGQHTIAIKTNGFIWAWGDNSSGQLGLGYVSTGVPIPTPIGTASDWSAIVAGGNHTLGLKTNRTIWAWGNNASGQLGLGDSGKIYNRKTPTQIGTTSDWSMVAGGGTHTIALKTNPAGGGTLWAWGWNPYGQLGLGVGFGGTGVDRLTPTQIGTASDWLLISAVFNHTLACKINPAYGGTGGTLWGWGSNSSGQLGFSDTNNRYTPTQIGTESDWSTLSAGAEHTVSIKTNGTIWVWGVNASGQLGLGDNANRNSPVRIGFDSDWSAVAGGGNHTLARKSNGTLWAWGDNDNFGQLGLGDNLDRNLPMMVGE